MAAQWAKGHRRGLSMGWERGRYYTRSRKVNGRVVREYVGAGRVAELAAQLDALDRDQREDERDARRAARAEFDALADKLSDLNERCDLITRAALIAAGFHQHKRGEWRKQRDHQATGGSALNLADGSGEAGQPPADPDRG
jgi:hypothetical protein